VSHHAPRRVSLQLQLFTFLTARLMALGHESGQQKAQPLMPFVCCQCSSSALSLHLRPRKAVWYPTAPAPAQFSAFFLVLSFLLHSICTSVTFPDSRRTNFCQILYFLMLQRGGWYRINWLGLLYSFPSSFHSGKLVLGVIEAIFLFQTYPQHRMACTPT
jgi:hypothetical protein